MFTKQFIYSKQMVPYRKSRVFLKLVWKSLLHLSALHVPMLQSFSKSGAVYAQGRLPSIQRSPTLPQALTHLLSADKVRSARVVDRTAQG